MDIKVICKDCNKEFGVSASMMMRDVVFINYAQIIIEEQEFRLSYFDCPYCGKRHHTQIDSNKTLSLVDSLLNLFKDRIATTNGKDATETEIAELNNQNTILEVLRDGLKKNLNGKKFVVVGDNPEVQHTLELISLEEVNNA